MISCSTSSNNCLLIESVYASSRYNVSICKSKNYLSNIQAMMVYVSDEWGHILVANTEARGVCDQQLHSLKSKAKRDCSQSMSACIDPTLPYAVGYSKFGLTMVT